MRKINRRDARLRRLTVIGLVSLVAIASACGSNASKASSGSSSSSKGGAQTRTVQVDGHTNAFNGGFLAYFPKSVVVHPGDTVAFHENWTGEPHSVTLGTLTQACIAAAASANPNGPEPAACTSLPTMLPEGPGDANQAAAQPCYLATGSPPSDPTQACPKLAQPAFDGTQTYYSSGWLHPGQTYPVHLATTIAPGTYAYDCDLHGADMSGAIVVVPSSQAIPSQSQVAAQAKSQLQALVNKLEPAYQAAKSGHALFPGNLEGYGSPDVMNAEINEFFPSTVHATVGQPVTWTVLGDHTISLGAPEDEPFISSAPDGSVHLNAQLLSPAGGPGQPQQPPMSGPPPSGPPKVVPVDGGAYSGTGFHSSGFITSFPPELTSYSITFTEPGTYKVDCVIHPHMEATVVVTQ